MCGLVFQESPKRARPGLRARVPVCTLMGSLLAVSHPQHLLLRTPKLLFPQHRARNQAPGNTNTCKSFRWTSRCCQPLDSMLSFWHSQSQHKQDQDNERGACSFQKVAKQSIFIDIQRTWPCGFWAKYISHPASANLHLVSDSKHCQNCAVFAWTHYAS